MIYLGADHGGYKLKERLKKYLKSRHLEFEDLGPHKLVPGDDYPDYAAQVAKKVSRNPVSDVGILLCRSGQGVCIVANKFKNVRAAVVWNIDEARMSRIDDMSNVLCLPSDYVNPTMAEAIVHMWLLTPYSTDQRHMRRIKKISALEK